MIPEAGSLADRVSAPTFQKNNNMSITVYNPSSKPAPEVLKTATRKTTLKGGILGIIDNSKPNSDTVLKRVADQLTDRFEVYEFFLSRYANA